VTDNFVRITLPYCILTHALNLL